jgi:hypothetical protein
MTELDRELCLAISPNQIESSPDEWAPEAKRALLAIIAHLGDNGYWQAADFLLTETELT